MSMERSATARSVEAAESASGSSHDHLGHWERMGGEGEGGREGSLHTDLLDDAVVAGEPGLLLGGGLGVGHFDCAVLGKNCLVQ